MTISGDGTITGLVAGGLPDATVTAAELSGAQTGSAPIYGARAWCVFDGGLAGTNAPISGGNVSTVTRNATGDYTVNFTTAMPDTSWAAFITFNQNSGGANAGFVNTTSIVAGSVSLYTTIPTTGAVNPSRVYVVVYR
jgi:phosphoribosylformylglycinamidine (FGAM) synthase-like enzyme